MHGRRRKSNFPAVLFGGVGIFALVWLLTLASSGDKPREPIIYSPAVSATDSGTADEGSGEAGPVGDTPVSSGHSPEDLPEQPRKLYDRIPEARDFALGCLDPHDEPEPEDIDLSGLDLSTVPDLHQWDERWGYARYAGNLFGLSGCGPTCMSMAAMYLTGNRDLNPLFVARYAEDNGYCYDGKGTAWALFTDGARGLGVSSRELPLEKSLIDSTLDTGGLVALVLGPGDFTDSGHFILLIGRKNGGYVIRDPNDPKNTARTWTYEALRPQIKDIWALLSEKA